MGARAVIWRTALAIVLASGLAARAPGAESPLTPPSFMGAFDAVADEFRISAESVQGTKQHMEYRGFVILTGGELRIEADEADYFDTRATDGTGGRRVEARGNVVFMQGEQRIAGDTLQMDLETGKGMLTNARGYVQPGVFFEAKTVERVASTKYRVTDARFTSCFQPRPRWGFSAKKANLKIDDHVLATWVNFKIKGVPTPLLLPAFYYPIQEDQRSTGFLFPSFGYSSVLGVTTGTGFFWAMSRSVDQTIQFDNFSKYGRRLSHEFRYMRPSPSSGTFSTEFTWPKGQEGQTGSDRYEYRFAWNATQMLPLGLRAQLSVNETSSTNYQNTIHDNFAELTNRYRNSSLSISRTVEGTNIQFNAERNDITFPEYQGNGLYEDVLQRRERLPSLRISRPASRIGRTGIQWGYEAKAEKLGLGDENNTDRYSRYDIGPEFSRPIAASFIQFTPRLRLRYTRWGGLERANDPDTPDINEGGFFHIPWERRYVEGSVEMRGPKFARVFSNPTGAYSERFKHEIGPEVMFVRRRLDTSLEPNDFPPVFDGDDLLPETTEVRYGLVQRFMAKRPGPSGKLVPYEFLVWRVSQTYYAQENASIYDPNYYSAAFRAEQEATQLSPIQSVIRFKPTTRLTSDFRLEYDTKRRKTRSISLTTNTQFSRFGANLSWSRSMLLYNNPAKNVVSFNSLSGGARVDPVPGKLRLEATAAYDYVNRRFVNRTYSVRYDVQCCGFFVERREIRYGGVIDSQLRFQVQLANIGSVGNFGQDDGYGPRGQAYGGMR